MTFQETVTVVGNSCRNALVGGVGCGHHPHIGDRRRNRRQFANAQHRYAYLGSDDHRCDGGCVFTNCEARQNYLVGDKNHQAPYQEGPIRGGQQHLQKT